jgi:putative endonuclease
VLINKEYFMKQENREKGKLGEELAVQELEKKGYQILERNFSTRFGEIDIIAKDGEVVVFVEVKAKTGILMGTPEEMIDASKLKRVENMAYVYLGQQKALCRIDVVAIVLDDTGMGVRLTHYQNVSI